MPDTEIRAEAQIPQDAAAAAIRRAYYAEDIASLKAQARAYDDDVTAVVETLPEWTEARDRKRKLAEATKDERDEIAALEAQARELALKQDGAKLANGHAERLRARIKAQRQALRREMEDLDGRQLIFDWARAAGAEVSA